jgi:hypothetical protein
MTVLVAAEPDQSRLFDRGAVYIELSPTSRGCSTAVRSTSSG